MMTSRETNMDQPLLNPIEIDVARLPSKGHRGKVDATAQELAAIRTAFELITIDNLHAELLLTRWHRDGVMISGTVSASLSQPCVVTLEPVPQEFSETVEQKFVPEGSPLARPRLDADGEMIIDPDGEDLPDTFTGTTIDVSNVIIEAFSLALDPFPRLPSARLDDRFQPDEGDGAKPESPFMVLKQLKKE